MPTIYWPLIIYQIIYIGAKLHISPLKPQYSKARQTEWKQWHSTGSFIKYDF